MSLVVKFVLVSVISAAVGAGVGVGITTIHFQQKTSALEQQLLAERQKQIQSNQDREDQMKKSRAMPGNMGTSFKKY